MSGPMTKLIIFISVWTKTVPRSVIPLLMLWLIPSFRQHTLNKDLQNIPVLYVITATQTVSRKLSLMRLEHGRYTILKHITRPVIVEKPLQKIIVGMKAVLQRNQRLILKASKPLSAHSAGQLIHKHSNLFPFQKTKVRKNSFFGKSQNRWNPQCQYYHCYVHRFRCALFPCCDKKIYQKNKIKNKKPFLSIGAAFFILCKLVL